jgi:DNA (cytosine-5)-methyltransferase 1
MYNPTANSYFSGAGLMDIGLMQAGVKVQQSLDIERNAINAMKMNPHYFGHKIIRGDVEQILVLEQPEADILVGTYPCNHYTEMADLFGTRIGDALFLHFFRLAVIGNYKMFVLENVPGMKAFPVVMEAMMNIPDYYITVFCPVEATNWLPQRRDRLILIGTKKPFTPAHPEKASRVPRIKDIIEKDAKVDVNDTVIARIKGAYRDKPIIVDPEDINSVAPTCVAHYAKDMGTRLVKDKSYPHGLRPFTIREYARLMGVPDDYRFAENRFSYKLIGNGVPVPMARWIGEQAIKYFN